MNTNPITHLPACDSPSLSTTKGANVLTVQKPFVLVIREHGQPTYISHVLQPKDTITVVPAGECTLIAVKPYKPYIDLFIIIPAVILLGLMGMYLKKT